MRHGIETVTVGQAVYSLRARLGWYALEQGDLTHHIKISLPAGVAGAMQDGKGLNDLDPDTPVGISMPGPEHTMSRVMARLCAWTWPVPLTEENVRQLSPEHIQAILAKCDELDEAERRASGDDNPFA